MKGVNWWAFQQKGQEETDIHEQNAPQAFPHSHQSQRLTEKKLKT